MTRALKKGLHSAGVRASLGDMSAVTTLKIACETRDYAALDELTDFQGNLKTLAPEDELKLRDEILDTGVAFPFFVWRDPKSKKLNLIDGHQRASVLRKLKAGSYVDSKDRKIEVRVPNLPVVFVKAGSIDEAKRRVLQAVSQYGKVQSKGLLEFIDGSSLKLQEIVNSFRMPDVNLDMLLKSQYPDPPKKVEFNAQAPAPQIEAKGKHECPRCGHKFDD